MAPGASVIFLHFCNCLKAPNATVAEFKPECLEGNGVFYTSMLGA